VNVACRDLLRAQRMVASAETYADPVVRLIARRCAESALQALRFRYRQPSTWDLLL
jgi:hypothetical protein